MAEDDREDELSSLERVSDEDCLRLLATDDVGRLAIVQGRVPAIFPVNYALDGRSIVFRTAPGTKLEHGPGSLAAFEIDRISRDDHTGWSVVAVGTLEEATGSDLELARLRDLIPDPWAGGRRDHVMRMVPGLVSGRRVGTAR